MKTSPSKNTRGFTLVEMSIVVAIVAVLSSIAIPTYQSAVNKARRGKIAIWCPYRPARPILSMKSRAPPGKPAASPTTKAPPTTQTLPATQSPPGNDELYCQASSPQSNRRPPLSRSTPPPAQRC